MESRIPLLGEEFPKLKVKTTHGVKNLPEDYKGRWFVLFSHPGDFTPVCTTEFVGFAKKADEFAKLNADLVGLSIDQVFSHIKWVEWIKDNMNVDIPFPIIADDMGEVAKSLGMISPAKGTNTVRAVFIVDDRGILRLIMYYPQEVGRNIDEVLRSLKALQVADKNKVAMPENWPNNGIIGDKVIIPPPSDMKTAMERKNQGEGFDWWFKFKTLV